MKKRKTYEISVIDKTYSKTISDETKFYTSDTSLELVFKLKETEYTFESAEIVLLNIDDRSLVTRPVSKVNNDYVYELDDDIIPHYGEWHGQLRFEQAGEFYGSSPVKFRIENDLGNERPPQLSDVQSWVNLKRYADGLVDELKQAVLSVEGIEDTFNENENIRQSQFETNESERQSAEQGRVEAEKQREGTVTKIENRQTFVENQFSIINQELTDKDVISAPEIIAARNGETTLNDRLDKEHQEVTAQLAQTEKLSSVFTKITENGEVSKIRLIGDSITYGTGASGVTPPATTNREIVIRQGTMIYEANEDYDSWANIFKRYIQEKYPEVDVFNAGIPGITAVEADHLKEDLIPEVDVLIIMLGTNDILQTSSLSEFESHMRSLLAYAQSKSKQMIVISPTPSLNEFEDEDETVLNSSRNFPLKDVDRVITSICVENGYFHISMFKEFLKFGSNTGIKLKDTLNDNLHPNDYGHSLFFGILQTKLGFVKTTKSMTVLNSLSDNKPYLQQDTELDNIFNKPIHDYEINKIHYSNVYTNYQDFPTNSRGLLETFRSSSELYSYQAYRPLYSTDVYTRFWTESGWGDFFRGETFREFNTTIDTPISNFPANTITYKHFPYSQRLDFPEQSEGLLVTYKAREAYSYQEYHPLRKNRVYKRFVKADGSWSDFELVGGVL